ncbi:MAG: hypothetical protein PHE68_02355 [Candidatus Peribacteraceae bacterium]|nr:hypothetical protein [Candidatus Peribacteraceae bacterium]MDD5074598.1 hypothetical protein [Candidatus Peribacteraceae bacterium]
MPDPAQPVSAVKVPDDLKQKFPELIELVLKSESMNDEERQYWVNILPVMTPEQVQNLKDILVNERDQLAAIDKKYSKEIEKIGEDQLLKKVDEERRKRREERAKSEEQQKQQEEEASKQILGKIQGKS